MTGPDGSGAPSLRVRVASLAAAGLALIGLVVLTTAIGPWTAVPTAPAEQRYEPRPPETLPSLVLPSFDQGSGSSSSFSIRPVLWAGVVVALVVLIVGAVLLLRQWRLRSRWVPKAAAPIPADDPPVVTPPAPPPSRTFDQRIAADYVIACWEQLEDVGSSIGRRRRPEQTPTEFLEALVVSAADQPAASRLLRLYQHARFDHTALAPDTIADARSATAVVLASLRGPDPQRADPQVAAEVPSTPGRS